MKYKFEPNYAVPPIETLKEVVQHYGIQADLTSEKEPYDTIMNIINRQAPSILEYVPKNFWNNLEKNYQDTLRRIQ